MNVVHMKKPKCHSGIWEDFIALSGHTDRINFEHGMTTYYQLYSGRGNWLLLRCCSLGARCCLGITYYLYFGIILGRAVTVFSGNNRILIWNVYYGDRSVFA